VGGGEAVKLGIGEKVRVDPRGEVRARVPERRRDDGKRHPSGERDRPGGVAESVKVGDLPTLGVDESRIAPDPGDQVRHARRTHRATAPARPNVSACIRAALDHRHRITTRRAARKKASEIATRPSLPAFGQRITFPVFFDW
jgi:hypothetical protein